MSSYVYEPGSVMKVVTLGGAINSGAITEDEALDITGLTADELRMRSFVKILRARGEAGAEGEGVPR